jgi:hypothetical protein
VSNHALQNLLQAAGPLGVVSSRDFDIGPYLVLAAVAHNMTAALRRGDTHRFNRFFEVLEAEIEKATPETRDLLVVGFLEDLQNISLHEEIQLEDWSGWLGTLTAEAWRVLIDMWSGRLAQGEFNRYISAGAVPRKYEN